MIIGIEDNYAPKDNVLRIEWNLGKKCNFDCSYCSPSIHDKVSDHIDLNVFKSTCEKLVKHAKSQGKKIKISLTGGEPYLHPSFIEMLKYIKDIGFYRTSITTNGSVPIKLYEESLQYIEYLVISLHFEFIKVDKMIDKIIKIKKSTNDKQGLHVHIMALPGKTDLLEEIKNKLIENDISYATRRIRPQFNKEGVYNQPFESGLLGDNKANFDLINARKLNYYSEKDKLNMQVSK